MVRNNWNRSSWQNGKEIYSEIYSKYIHGLKFFKLLKTPPSRSSEQALNC